MTFYNLCYNPVIYSQLEGILILVAYCHVAKSFFYRTRF